MISEKKLGNSFQNIRREINQLSYDAQNYLRYLDVKAKEQGIRIDELERRLAQVERLIIREKLIG